MSTELNVAAPRANWIPLLLAALALLAPWVAAALAPPFAQPQAFHDYADQRALLSVPHALNVLSNLPFLLVGVWGLRVCRAGAMPAPGVRAAYAVLFAGAALTAFGSVWYHLNPNDATLVWDRLPMALGFAGLVAGTLADRAPRAAPWLLGAFVAVGTGSVLTWAASGNLVPYLVMQGGFIAIALLAAAALRSPYSHGGWLFGAAALYGLALAAERLDHALHAALGALASGHTIKHLLAAAAIALLAWMLRQRRPR